jgi:hypothetical protein
MKSKGNLLSMIAANVAPDPHNFDLVGFGNAICWRLYEGEAPSQIAESAFNESRNGKQAGITHDQADVAVRSAKADLCPDAAPK